MGKASSSKKVARAAGTGGGRTNRARTPWTFFGVVVLIIVLGVVLTWTSRHRYEVQLTSKTNSNAAVAPKVGGTAWNEGYAIYACGKFLKPITAKTTSTGITTAGDGVIHIAPKVKAAAGKNATLGVFASSVGLKLTATEIQVPGGKAYVNGDDCSGKQAKVYVKQYSYVGAPKGVIETTNPSSTRLANGALVTLAFVPESQKAKIPPPPKSVQDALTKATTPTTTTTTTTTTVPSKTTTTTSSSTTTVPSTTTTTAKS